jgi:putative transposase
VECGFAAHADQVGAYNILSRGMEKLRDEGRDTADASVGWLEGWLSSHSPDRPFAEHFGEPGLAPV